MYSRKQCITQTTDSRLHWLPAPVASLNLRYIRSDACLAPARLTRRSYRRSRGAFMAAVLAFAVHLVRLFDRRLADAG